MDYVWLTISFTIPLTTQFTIVDYHRAKWTFFSHDNSFKTRLNNSVFSGLKPSHVSFARHLCYNSTEEAHGGLTPVDPEEMRDALD